MSKICLVAHFAYGALKHGDSGHVGGVERQMSILGPWLAAQGHEVSILTWDEGHPNDEIINGVRVIKICKQSAGLPIIRFFMPRWSGLIAAMKKANADIYYQNCAELVTGQVAFWCRKNNRRFVYSVASDPDCEADLKKFKKTYERVLYRKGLELADAIIVQNRYQQSSLKSGFGRDSTILRMPIDGPTDVSMERPSQARVLWVGRLVTVKRLEWLLEISALCPDIHFDVVGPEYENTEQARLNLEQMREAHNVTYHGRVALKDMAPYYRRASLLCNTSVLEGFPNTFIEAWANGRPVVSSVDPDGLISSSDLGRHFSSPEEAAGIISQIVSDPVLWQSMADASRSYFLDQHETSAAIPRFENVLLNEAQE
ncbi:MAG: glycosyltransferase family 4 protein [Pseudomonadota bacterium]